MSNPIAGQPSGPADVAALAEPTRPVSRLWVLWLALISIGVWSGFFGPIQVLLAQQADRVAAADHEPPVLDGRCLGVDGKGRGGHDRAQA